MRRHIKVKGKNWITLQELFLSSVGLSLMTPGGFLWNRGSTWGLYWSDTVDEQDRAILWQPSLAEILPWCRCPLSSLQSRSHRWLSSIRCDDVIAERPLFMSDNLCGYQIEQHRLTQWANLPDFSGHCRWTLRDRMEICRRWDEHFENAEAAGRHWINLGIGLELGSVGAGCSIKILKLSFIWWLILIKWIRNSNDKLMKTWLLLGCGITRKMPGMTLSFEPLAGNRCKHDW